MSVLYIGTPIRISFNSVVYLDARSAMMPRRNNTLVLAVLGAAAFVALLCISITQGADGSRFLPSSYQDAASLHLDEGILHGENKATKIENATLKYVSGDRKC